MTAELDEQQLVAVTSAAPRLGIVAGAGTGKTRVLTHRAARLLERYLPHRVLCVTFTRRAAGEMLARLHGMVEHLPEVRTLHSWAGSLIRDHPDAVGRTSRFVVYDALDALEVLRGCAAEHGFRGNPWKARRSTLWKDEGIRALYLRRLQEADALDYDQLEELALALLKQGHGQGRYDHVLVDEAQDLSPGQSELLAYLNPPELTMVGDPRQSIYAFRGSDPRILRRFLEAPTTEVVVLAENYRSRGGIVATANQAGPQDWGLMSANREALAGRDVRWWVADYAERQVAAELQTLAAEGLDLDTVAVLARTWKELELVRDELQRRDVPVVFYGETSDVWTQPDPRMLAWCLSMAEGRVDDNLGARVVNWGRERFGGPELLELRARAVRERRAVIDVAGDTSPAMRRLWTALLTAEDAGDLAREVLEAVLGSVPARLADLVETMDGMSVLDWRSWWGLERETLDRGEGLSGVHVLTIHAAKGLEWPTVYAMGCNDGAFPPRHSAPEDVLESQRVLYVMITRARDQLTLIRPVHFRGSATSWSPFLVEAAR